MAYSNYLVHLPSSYYFRFHILLKLQEVVGKKEIRYSLRCRTLSEAKPKARLIAGKIQQLFENGRIMELSKQQIQDLISKYVKESLKAGENSRLERNTPISPGDLDHLLESIEVLRDGRKEDFARCDYSSIMDSVDNLLQDAGIKLDKGSRGYNILARELLKVEIKLFEIEHKKTLGDYTLTEGEKAVLDPTGSTLDKESQEPSETLSEVIQSYWDENIRAGTWKARTKAEYKPNLELIKDFLGKETRIKEIDSSRLREFKDTLLNLPKMFKTKKEYIGMSLKDIAALNIPQEERISISTINDKHLGLLQAVFNYAEQNGYITTNPSRGLKIKAPKKRKASEEQDIFLKDDLKKLFSSQEYREGKYDQPFKFWLPLLGLYTGCRIEELCQLYVEGIKKEDGIYILDINRLCCIA